MFELGFRVYFGRQLFTSMRRTSFPLLSSFSAWSQHHRSSPPHKTIKATVAKPHSLRWSNQVPFFLAKNGHARVTINNLSQSSNPLVRAAPRCDPL